MPCEDLLYGRMSFKGFNPEIEVLFKYSLLRWSHIRIETLGNRDFSVHPPCCLAFAAPSVNSLMCKKTAILTKMLINVASGK